VFEGSEKKVEIIVDSGLSSLRGRVDLWPKVVRQCGAEILSKKSGCLCDAYLLSESSLFVYDHSMIMITCGQTSLINSVLEVLKVIDLKWVKLLVYERKNELFPHLQSTTFEQDTTLLQELMPGKVFYFGDKGGNQVKLFHLETDFHPVEKDMTVEILMHGLSPGILPLFHKQKSIDTLRRETGICEILPGFLTDDYLFDPCGYSMNGIRKHAYFTSHVTPEPEYSYASFETNFYFNDNINQTLDRVIDLFQPSRFAVVLFEPTTKMNQLNLQWKPNIEDVQVLDCGYRFHFYDFSKR
jgi:S-adenosylmethionine decarboxylase